MLTYFVNYATIFTALFAAVGMALLLTKANALPHLDETHNRYGYIDGLRGLAALGVFVNHAAASVGQSGSVSPDMRLTGHILEITGNPGITGVHIFFCITGFLFFNKILSGPINWPSFYAARLKRLAPLYVAISIVIIGIALIETAPAITFDRKLLYSIINMFSFGFWPVADINGYSVFYPRAAVWTLPLEWTFYFLLPALAALCNRKAAKFAIPILAVIILVNLSLKNVNAIWAYFVIGAAAALLNNQAFSVTKKTKLALSLLALAFTAGVINSSSSDFGLGRFFAIAIIFLSVVIAKPALLSAKPVRLLGEISYSVYLLHLPIFLLFYKCAVPFYDFSGLTKPGYVVLSCLLAVITVLISTLTFKYIEYPWIAKKEATKAPATEGALRVS